MSCFKVNFLKDLEEYCATFARNGYSIPKSITVNRETFYAILFDVHQHDWSPNGDPEVLESLASFTVGLKYGSVTIKKEIKE